MGKNQTTFKDNLNALSVENHHFIKRSYLTAISTPELEQWQI